MDDIKGEDCNGFEFFVNPGREDPLRSLERKVDVTRVECALFVVG